MGWEWLDSGGAQAGWIEGGGEWGFVPAIGASMRDGVQPSVMRISLSLGMIMGVTR